MDHDDLPQPASKPDWTPIYQVFCLLSASRRLINPTAQGFRRKLLKRGLRLDPRLSFWIGLCRACHLLDGGRPPRPTIRLPEWWARPLAQQVRDLVRAWPLASHSAALFRARRRVLEQFFDGGSGDWFAESYPFDLTGLKALGLWDEAANALSLWGRQVFSPLPAAALLPDQPLPQPWRFEDEVLVAPLPADWALLWELEGFLEPDRVERGEAWRQSGGHLPREIRYRVDRAALARAAHHVPLYRLREVLQAGLKQPLPPLFGGLVDQYAGVRLLEGTVLEFASAQELARLRTQAVLRGLMNRLVSRRHVLLAPWQVKPAVRALAARGLLAPASETPPPRPGMPRSRRDREQFSSAERAELLFQALLVQQVLPQGWVSLDLLEKLQDDLPDALVIAAGQRAERIARAVNLDAAGQLHPDALAPRLAPAGPPPPPGLQIPGPLEEMRARLVQAAAHEETLDLWYQKPGAAPEKRRVSPLLVEDRPGGWVLIAYCHRRRDNRTFRLDRMALVEDSAPLSE